MIYGKEDIKVILKDFGEITTAFAFSLLIPLILSLFESPPNILPFAIPFLFSLLIGLALKKIKAKRPTTITHAFVVVLLVWIFIPMLGGLPFWIWGKSFLDSYFESMSAITTTGLMVIWDKMPPSLTFWRSFESWIGGAGIVILALAGIIHFSKAHKLFLAEGRDERIVPNIKRTAKYIWWVYTLITGIGVALLLFAGADLFTAINLSMSAISTTGVEMYHGQLLELNNPMLEAALAIIMFMGAISFLVHYAFIRGKLKAYVQDCETKVLFALSFFSILFLFIHTPTLSNLRWSFFHVISAATCGGFQIGSVNDPFTFTILSLLMFIGGAVGSTAGGIKIFRFVALTKSIYWMIKKAMLPEKAFFRKQACGRILREEDISLIWFFVLMYTIFVFGGALIISWFGYNMEDALFETISAQGNAGLTSGISSPTTPWPVKVVLIVNMLVGRIEIWPVLFGFGFLMGLRRKAY